MLSSIQLIDELHKVFQVIDRDGKGFLEVSEILEFQQSIAESKGFMGFSQPFVEEGVKVSKVDENTVISMFLIKAESTHRNESSGVKQQKGAGIVIDWGAFRNTMIEWLVNMSSQMIGLTLIDQSGYLAFRDRIVLHQIIVAFFLQTHKDKKIEVLTRACLSMENLERDIENLSIYGTTGISNSQTQSETIVLSKFIANSFSSILNDIQTQDVNLVLAAIERLRQMFDVLCHCSNKFELLEISDHLRRIFDLVFSSSLIDIFGQILDMQDEMTVCQIKIDVLRLIALMSTGTRLFSQNTDISVTQNDEEQDQQFMQRLQSSLMNYDLIVKVINQNYSQCLEVRDQTFLTIGHLIKNGLDLQSLLFEDGALNALLSQIHQTQMQSSLRYVTWLLYIISKKYYEPGEQGIVLTEKQIEYVTPLFQKLSEVLFRDDVSQELAILAILGLGKVVHMQPPCDLLNEVFSQMVNQVLNLASPNAMLTLAVLRLIYDTSRFTRVHSSFLVQQLKIVQVVQSLIDKNIDEKVTISSFQILKELCISGHHMAMIDNMFLGSILRILQSVENPMYIPALDLVKNLVETSTYNSGHLTSFGFIRILSQNLSEIRLYKDVPIQGSYDPSFTDGGQPLNMGVLLTGMQKIGQNFNKTPIGSSNFKAYSFGNLFKTIQLLDVFLTSMVNKRQQIVASFTLESIERFKPLIDQLYSLLETLSVVEPIKVKTSEVILKFLISLKDKSGLQFSSPSRLEDNQFKLVDFIRSLMGPKKLEFALHIPGNRSG